MAEDDPLVQLTPAQTERIHQQIRIDTEAIESEVGQFKTEDLDSGRVLLTGTNGEQLVCYMSDDSEDARLCLDDYIPELAGVEDA